MPEPRTFLLSRKNAAYSHTGLLQASIPSITSLKKNAPSPGAFRNSIKWMTYQKGRSSIGSVISLADGTLLFDEGVVLAAAPVL